MRVCLKAPKVARWLKENDVLSWPADISLSCLVLGIIKVVNQSHDVVYFEQDWKCHWFCILLFEFVFWLSLILWQWGGHWVQHSCQWPMRPTGNSQIRNQKKIQPGFKNKRFWRNHLFDTSLFPLNLSVQAWDMCFFHWTDKKQNNNALAMQVNCHCQWWHWLNEIHHEASCQCIYVSIVTVTW